VVRDNENPLVLGKVLKAGYLDVVPEGDKSLEEGG
jgi:hypothetical protein